MAVTEATGLHDNRKTRFHDLQDGQSARGESTGIDAYPLRPGFRFRHRRVAVDDKEVQSRALGQKRFPDPQHVLIGLRFERQTRTQAGMHKI